MNYLFSIFITLLPSLLCGQTGEQDIKLEIFLDSLEFFSDTALYNNYEHNTLDTNTVATSNIFIVRLTNNSNSRLAFANISSELSELNKTNGKSYCLNKFNNLTSSIEAEIGYSISENGRNLPYYYYLGSACAQSRYNINIHDYVSSIKNISSDSMLQDIRYLYMTSEDLRKKGCYSTKINSLLVLDPGNYYEWEIVYKDCMLFNFEGIEWNKCYDFVITYYQNNNIQIPDINIGDVEFFSGFLLSNVVRVTFKN